MIDETLLDAEERMEKAVTVAKDELSTVRTGRANPAMFSRIHVDYYGSPTPINQMASIAIPEARMVIIKPYDASSLSITSRSDIGLRPGSIVARSTTCTIAAQRSTCRRSCRTRQFVRSCSCTRAQPVSPRSRTRTSCTAGRSR